MSMLNLAAFRDFTCVKYTALQVTAQI